MLRVLCWTAQPCSSRARRAPARARWRQRSSGPEAGCSATTPSRLQLSDGALIAHAGSTGAAAARSRGPATLAISNAAVLGRPTSSVDDKHRYVSDGAPEPAPLGGLFLLERSAEQPAVERLAAVDPFELLASTFNLSVRTPARLQRQLDVVSAIATDGLAHRLRVQPGIDATRLAAMSKSISPRSRRRERRSRVGAAGALSDDVLAGAWGARAGELLEGIAEREGARIHRDGGLTMLSAPPASWMAAGAAGCSASRKTAALLSARFGAGAATST